MDLKKSSITADILNVLSDCKIHTLQEIADIVEVDLQRPRKRESQEFIAIQESIVSQLNIEE